MMINFKIDYADGAHPKILEKLLTTNADQTPGYGEDDYCQQAQAAIQSYLGSTPVSYTHLTLPTIRLV